MITSIIFSKDRALQLDLTLQSIQKNFTQSDQINVIYNTSEEKFCRSYDQLVQDYPDVKFVKQEYSLFCDISETINAANNDYVCFFTDDNVVFNSVKLSETKLKKIFDLQCSCFSLRLGVNSQLRDYGDGQFRNDVIPQLRMVDDFLIWNRTTIPIGGYWSYPLSVDGHIFEKSTINLFCKELKVLNKHYSYQGTRREKNCWRQTPNEFESKLQRFWFDLPPMMASPKESCVVNSPNNRVQNTAQNRHGDTYSYSSQQLNDLFATGKRIDMEMIDFKNIKCPHQEIDILEGVS